MPDAKNNALKISPNLKAIFLPATLILTMLVLYALVISQGYSRVNDVLTNLRQAKIDENTLDTKLSTLKTLDKAVLSNSDASVLAVPQEDPVMFMLNQLRDSADQNTSEISDVRLKVQGTGRTKDLSSAKLNLSIRGPDVNAIVNILKSVADVAPMTTIDSVQVTTDASGTSSDVELVLYWAPFPEELPKLEEPVQSLSADEKSLLDKLTNLKAPTFKDLTPQEPTERTNPFN